MKSHFGFWCGYGYYIEKDGKLYQARYDDEEGAHTIADYASHKHRFERRESTNEFLKKMNDHKNGTTEEEQDRLS